MKRCRVSIVLLFTLAISGCSYLGAIGKLFGSSSNSGTVVSAQVGHRQVKVGGYHGGDNSGKVVTGQTNKALDDFIYNPPDWNEWLQKVFEHWMYLVLGYVLGCVSCRLLAKWKAKRYSQKVDKHKDGGK